MDSGAAAVQVQGPMFNAGGKTGRPWVRVDRVEREAIGDLFDAAPVEIVARYGVRLRREDDSTLLVATRHLDQPKMNRVVGLGAFQPADEARLDAALGWLAQHAHPCGVVQVAPDPGAVDLPGWLEARGLRVADHGWARLRRGADPVVTPASAPTLKIRPAEGRDAAALGAIVVRGFGLPDDLAPWYAALVGRPRWRTYLAWRGGEPIAAGSLYMGDGAGWLGTGATLPEARRSGAQSALLARRVADGLALGLVEFGTEVQGPAPGEVETPSHRNGLRAGFALAYLRRNYGRVGPG